MRSGRLSAGGITTFYSYKGGGGRSMALANVAWALASNGADVLALDWDLEAPGLHRYFHPFLDDPELVRTDGLMDRLWDFVSEVSGKDGDVDCAPWCDLSGIATRLALPTGVTGSLSFVCAGRQDDDYSAKVNGFDWTTFYEYLSGRAFVDGLAAWARSSYDVVLIDSRTGVSDSAGICTVQMPSTVVLTFVYNRQSIEGTAAVARSIRGQRDAKGRPVRILPVPTRVEEKQAAAHARRYAAIELHAVVGCDVEETYRDLRIAEIRHHFWCAYEEKLAVFEEDPEERGTLLSDMHALASRIHRPVEPVVLDAEELARFWRRAAFADPRMADLEALPGKNAREGAATLARWLGEALEGDGERTDWLAALAARCVANAQEPGAWAETPAGRDRLADGGIELARRVAARRANGAYDEDLARLLLQRAQHLGDKGLTDRASPLVAEASVLLRERGGPGTAALARALEQHGRLALDAGDPDKADDLLWQAGAAYARAAGGDPRLWSAAVRVLVRLTATRNARGRHDQARAAYERAAAFIEAGTAAGVEISQAATVASLIEIARAAVSSGPGAAARQAVQEAIDTSAGLGEEPSSRRLKGEALVLWTRLLLAENDVERARAALAAASEFVPDGLPAIERDILSAEIDMQAGQPARARDGVRQAIAHLQHDDLPRSSWMRIFSILNVDPASAQPAARRRRSERKRITGQAAGRPPDGDQTP